MRPIIIADQRIPREAMKTLSGFGDVLTLTSDRVVYPEISGHPDIFFTQTDLGLVYAPNTPEYLVSQLREREVRLIRGASALGPAYPQTAHYNAVTTPHLLIHDPAVTDPVLAEFTQDLEKVNVRQGYARCNTIALHADRFITSDRGVEKVLLHKGKEVLFVDPAGIVLPGYAHGFIGGTCGVYDGTIFFLGALKHFPGKDTILSFVREETIAELYDGPLFDGGSLIFIS